MADKKYSVTIFQTVATESLITEFAKCFKMDVFKARKILEKPSFAVKKHTDKTTAEKYYKLISTLGINCELKEIVSSSNNDLPFIEEVKTSPNVKPLLDITQQTITPLHQEKPVDLSLTAQPEQTPPEKKVPPKAIKDVNPEHFCPDCGTIRAGTDSICNHCNYDPNDKIRHNKKKKMIIATLIITTLAFAGGVSFPFIQVFIKRFQIENDLSLAFDTRNTISDFILKTNFWPNQNIDAGLDENISNSSIKSITIGENALMTTTIRGRALDGKDQTLVFTPKILKGRILWNCRKGTLSQKYRPEICRTQGLTE